MKAVPATSSFPEAGHTRDPMDTWDGTDVTIQRPPFFIQEAGAQNQRIELTQFGSGLHPS